MKTNQFDYLRSTRSQEIVFMTKIMIKVQSSSNASLHKHIPKMMFIGRHCRCQSFKMSSGLEHHHKHTYPCKTHKHTDKPYAQIFPGIFRTISVTTCDQASDEWAGRSTAALGACGGLTVSSAHIQAVMMSDWTGSGKIFKKGVFFKL